VPSPLAAAADEAVPLLLHRLNDTFDQNRQLAYELLCGTPALGRIREGSSWLNHA